VATASVRSAFSGTRGLVRLVYRDPDHVAERLTLYAAGALGPQSREWAERVQRERPGTPRAHIAEELRRQSAGVARVDGAVAGTPFFIALVPGYVAYLWQEARMTLRIAALYGRDPTDMHTAAEALVLRGVHPTMEDAERSLRDVRARPLPEAPATRRPLRTWYDSVYRLLVFGGFLEAPGNGAAHRSRLRTVAGAVLATLIWATTWVFPVTFMIAMSWGCESHARTLGRRALAFYDGDAASAQAAAALAAARHDRGRDRRRAIRSIGLGLSIAIPIVFVAYANHVRNTVGINWLGAIGALVALSLVGAVSVAASRR
jgi:hypothetical protein